MYSLERYHLSGAMVARVAVLVSATSLIALATPAAAQVVSSSNEKSVDRTGIFGGIEDIVVTARRKEENLQSVPVAVTAVSQDVLSTNNITTVRELQTLVPSLTISTTFKGDTANFVIRGQGASGIGGNPAVAMYLNEVPLPVEFDGGISGGPGLLFDVENVQVLKGPQGTLFGRNTMGGAILLQTAQPKDEFGGKVQIGYGNYDNREIDGAINLPIISEKLLARFAFNVQKRDGYTHVLSTPSDPDGLDLNNRDTIGVRGALSFRPSDAFRNDLTVTYTRYKNNGFAEFIVGFDPAASFFDDATNQLVLGILAEQQALGTKRHLPSSVDFNGTGGNLLSVQNITTVDVSDDIKFRNILGYNLAKWDFGQSEIDGTPLALLETIQSTFRNRQITVEPQFQGTSFDGSLDWVVGAFYLDARPPKGQPSPNVGKYQLLVNSVFGGLSSDLRARASTSKALYAQGSYAVTDSLRLTAGLRYTWDKRTELHKDPVTLVSAPDLVAKNDAPTWTLGIDYKIDSRTLLYVTSRRGYRAGGSQTIRTLQVAYAPEFVTDVEGGIKADWGLGSIPMRTNAAIFYQDYKDIQIPQTKVITFPDGSTDIGTITANAAAARLWGFEFEASANITPRLQLGANVSYLNFKYTKFQAGVSIPDLTTAGRADRVPWTYGFNGRYSLPVDESLGEIALQASYAWRDKSYDTAGVNRLQPYGLVNASLNWNDIALSGFDASLFVSNLTNKKYIAGGTSFFGFNVGTYGEPRMYGIRLGYRFGGERR